MNITEKDLIGEIKDFPIEVVQKMIERQVEQGNEADVSVFQEKRAVGFGFGGFYWSETIEEEDFWSSVIDEKNFDVFFAKYPKERGGKEEEDYWIDPKGRRMLVWDYDEEQAKERIVIAKLPPEAIGRQYIAVIEDDKFEKREIYSTMYWNCAKPAPTKTKLSLSSIAEKFGLSVDEIEIDFDK